MYLINGHSQFRIMHNKLLQDAIFKASYSCWVDCPPDVLFFSCKRLGGGTLTYSFWIFTWKCLAITYTVMLRSHVLQSCLVFLCGYAL